MAGKKTKSPKQVDSTKHRDRRVNIPTEELRDFVAEEEAAPEVLLYPRDPSLDPQLVWRGKDAQDSEDLAVPAVPVYIQEKIHPQAIIEDLRTQAKRDAPREQLALFDDFNGLEFEDLIEFYQHDQNWTNRMILGDSLLVMTSLAEKEGLKGQVQMIYIDPPYGIKFGSNWQVSTRKRDVKDGKAEDATRQPEQVRAFRDTWKLGIHSYLAYFRDRLAVAQELLTETGSVFVQIGDENVHLVRCVMDEVFGSESFVGLINYRSMMPLASAEIESVYDYVLWYAKRKENLKYRNLWIQKAVGGSSEFVLADTPDGGYRRLTKDEVENIQRTLAQETVFKRSNLSSSGYTASCTFDIGFKGELFHPVQGKSWRTTSDGVKRLIAANRVFKLGDKLYFKLYHSDFGFTSLENSWPDTIAFEEKFYVVQTTTTVIQRCLLMTTDPGDLVLDPTCGSGTTAYVAEQWGRRWITCDTSRVALALARTRLMAAKYPYYLLADSTEGIRKETELTGKMLPEYKTAGDVRKGFVYKPVPHVTLKSIANNPDIQEGMTRQQIDAAIARHAETETLYDQPYEDRKTVRVSGPFTVESLSPHRVMSSDEGLPASHTAGRRIHAGEFEMMIIDNLKKAGVQNTIKNERLNFDRLEPYAGEWLQAEGEYAERDGTLRRVAVAIGPEHGTVGAQLVKEAAKEAVRGVAFDLLIVCGFAFDPHVSEEARRYGELTVLPARMNPDLAMGDTLLKKTGAGNLFMVFGEPDVEIQQAGGQVTVDIKGLDIYDPTTGEIRASSTDDIACWFIDTNYDEESFFVRHAYFTGADEPYEKLKRALRAEIDEDAWSTLYSTVSRPFDAPQTGKIAIKVINHYGDEVLKVYDMSASGGGG